MSVQFKLMREQSKAGSRSVQVCVCVCGSCPYVPRLSTWPRHVEKQ